MTIVDRAGRVVKLTSVSHLPRVNSSARTASARGVTAAAPSTTGDTDLRPARRPVVAGSSGEYFTIRPPNKYADAAFVVRQTAPEPIVGPRRHAEYFRNTLLALYPMPNGPDIKYLVGLLNSKLLRWTYRISTREASQKAFPQVKIRSLRALPIRSLNLEISRDRDMHNRVISLVDRLLKLSSRLDDLMSPNDRRLTLAKIAATDRQLDTVVYELYGLTPSEVEIVESSYSDMLVRPA